MRRNAINRHFINENEFSSLRAFDAYAQRVLTANRQNSIVTIFQTVGMIPRLRSHTKQKIRSLESSKPDFDPILGIRDIQPSSLTAYFAAKEKVRSKNQIIMLFKEFKEDLSNSWMMTCWRSKENSTQSNQMCPISIKWTSSDLFHDATIKLL